MTTPFADRFAEARSSSIEVEGETLNSLVELAVTTPLTFTIVRIRAREDRAQGLVLDAGDQKMTVDRTDASRLTLWSDTAPEIVNVHLPDAGRSTVRVWNTWRDSGVEQAWVGWAAIKRRDDDGVITLSCRDGNEDGDFDDLVVELTYGSGADSGVLTTAFQ